MFLQDLRSFAPLESKWNFLFFFFRQLDPASGSSPSGKLPGSALQGCPKKHENNWEKLATLAYVPSLVSSCWCGALYRCQNVPPCKE